MEFIYYFGNVFQPMSFLLLLVGTIGGLILGATPGLSPTMAVAPKNPVVAILTNATPVQATTTWRSALPGAGLKTRLSNATNSGFTKEAPIRL